MHLVAGGPTIDASPPTRDVWALHYAECSRQAREAQDASEAYEDVVSEAESELEEKAPAVQAQTGFVQDSSRPVVK